jgi:hypothetical protein
MVTKRHVFALLILFVGAVTGYAQQSDAPSIPVEEIIRKFAEKEQQFKTARANYAYRQEVKVQELSASDRVLGEFSMTTDISFDDKGKRVEKVVHAPPSTLDRLQMTPQDFENIEAIQPFVLTSEDVGLYNLKYSGREKVDEITTYVFDVAPKKMEKNKLYFQGKIWVDDQDFQIVKTAGKPVPDIRDKGKENLFGRFETYREYIDGYWFPTYTRVADTLQFSTGAIRMRQIIRYSNYKRFGVDVELKFGGEANGATPGTTSKDDTAAPPKDNTAPALDPKYKTQNR